MGYYILLDSEDYVIGNLHAPSAPPGYIEAPEPTRVYVRAKYDTVNMVYYEGATEAEIDDQVRVLLEMMSVNLDASDKQMYRVFFDRRGNLGNIIQERQAFYDSFYAQILEIKPTFVIPTNDSFYIPFKLTLTAASDGSSIFIPLMHGVTEIRHATINKTTVIENPPYNPITGEVTINVKSGDTIDFTI